MMQRVGLIGGDDFVGCYVALKYLAEDYRVRIPKIYPGRKANLNSLPGIYSNRNLELVKMNPDEMSEMVEFVKDCDFIVHCGFPVKMNVDFNGSALYIPLVKGTAQLLKAARLAPSVKKIIFVTSPSIFSATPNNSMSSQAKSRQNKFSAHAKYHAEKTISKLITDFPDDFFDVIVMAPAEIKNNEPQSTPLSLSFALQFLFRNETDHDPVLKQLFKRNVLRTMVSPENIPEAVFECTIRERQTFSSGYKLDKVMAF